MRIGDLVSVAADTFYVGMHIEGEIYFKYEKSYILLCKNMAISDALLEKFYQTEWGNQTLFVDKKYLPGIMELSKQHKQKHEDSGEPPPTFEKPEGHEAAMPDAIELAAKINLQEDYNDIKLRLNQMMKSVEKEGTVDLDAHGELTVDIRKKIELTDPALLIECINNLREPDDYLNAHAANVAMLNGMIGGWLNMSHEEIDALIKTGLLHDVGKLRIPLEILDKPGALTDEEFAVMKKHPAYSYEILKLSGETDNRVIEGALSHHEKLNGGGYPSGLTVTQISLFARITAVSDVYDAMVARRVYKDSHSPFEILAEFAVNKFSHLDIGIVNVFLDKMPSVLLGKNVLLTDGRTARVAFINTHNLAYPLVEVDGELISTSPDLDCVSMENFLAMIEG